MKGKENQYVYIFTRQDISPEQQLVQSAHVAMVLGNEIARKGFSTDPRETYFTVVGVKNLDGLEAVLDILCDNGFYHTIFREPDMGNEITSIATYPVFESQRGVLLAFSWLRF